MTIFFHDYETFGTLPFGSSKSVGMYRYTRDPQFQVLMMAYAFDNGPVQLWVPKDLFDLEEVRIKVSGGYASNLQYFTNSDTYIQGALDDPDTIKHAHNAEFERLCTTQCPQWRLPPWSEYQCNAAQCSTLALPRGLDDVAPLLKLKGKDKEGKALINKFSKPRKPTKKDDRTRIMPMDDPEAFIDFGMYCIQDVQVERKVHNELLPYAMSEYEQRVWQMNCEANDRGIPIDIANVRKAWNVVEQFIEKDGGVFREITGLNVTQRDKAQKWFNANGLKLLNMQGENTVDPMLAKIKSGDVKVPANVATALRTYRTAGRSSVKKLKTMLDHATAQGRAHGASTYHGCQPGRYAGQLVKLDNFARPSRAIGDTMLAFDIVNTGDFELLNFCYADPMEAISSTLRHYVKAGPGKELLVADFAQVEPRGICWLAGEEEALEEYRQGLDRYVKFSANMKGVTYEEMMTQYKDGDTEAAFLRQGGKVGIIQCGYQSGKKSVRDAAEKNFGLVLTMDEADKIVKAYRSQHPKVVQLWHDVGEAAMIAIRTGKNQRVGKLLIGMKGDFLFIKLPSGRKIAYPFPRIEKQTAPWDRIEVADLTAEYKILDKGSDEAAELRVKIASVKRRPKRDTIVYWGKKEQRWLWRTTYGGKLCQNVTEAICRDLLVNGMIKAEPHGIDYISPVHDELINEVAEGVHTIADYNRIICDLPDWAAGFPLSAEGYIAKHYKK